MLKWGTLGASVIVLGPEVKGVKNDSVRTIAYRGGYKVGKKQLMEQCFTVFEEKRLGVMGQRESGIHLPRESQGASFRGRRVLKPNCKFKQ